MRRAMLLIVGFGAGGSVFALLVLSVAVQCAAKPTFCYTEIAFPCAVEGTQLQALKMVSYEGPFWEDRTDEEVALVAALLIENTGILPIARGAVILEWDGHYMVFELYDLPPGAQVLVLEKDRQAYCQRFPMRCYGWEQESYPEIHSGIVVQEGGVLKLVNTTEGVIPKVSLRFKSYDPVSGFFVGGITYSTEVVCLQPGEVREIFPYHYSYGYSKVVSIIVSGAQ